MDGYGGYEETIESRGGAAEHPLLNVGPTPRIECGAVTSFTGRKVRIVGELVGIRDDRTGFVLKSSDGQSVTVRSSDPHAVSGCKFLETVGAVNMDGSVSELGSTPFSDTFDLKLYGQAIQATSKYAMA